MAAVLSKRVTRGMTRNRVDRSGSCDLVGVVLPLLLLVGVLGGVVGSSYTRGVAGSSPAAPTLLDVLVCGCGGGMAGSFKIECGASEP